MTSLRGTPKFLKTTSLSNSMGIFPGGKVILEPRPMTFVV
jgi:hypothetical protein